MNLGLYYDCELQDIQLQLKKQKFSVTDIRDAILIQNKCAVCLYNIYECKCVEEIDSSADTSE